MRMTHSIQITKFKIRQCHLVAILPNLMLAVVSRYTVCGNYLNKDATAFYCYGFTNVRPQLKYQSHGNLFSLSELHNIIILLSESDLWVEGLC